MRHTRTRLLAAVAGALLLSALAAAQGDAPRSPWKYYPEDARANVGPGGPAPVRDLSGTWAGEASGAGVKGGQAIGATDDLGFAAVEEKVHVSDLHATLLHLLGLDHTKLTYFYQGFNQRITGVRGEVVRKVLA